MSLDLLDAAKRLLPDALVSKAAMSLGETEVNIRKALKGAIPSVLAGLLHQTSRGEGPGITDLLKSVDSSGIVNNLAALVESKTNSSNPAAGAESHGAQIPAWLRSVFGGKVINIINAISIYSDIKSSSANAMLNLAAPAALAPIAIYSREKNLGAADINTLLQSQKYAIIQSIPAGFNLSGSLGINSLDDIGTKIITIEPKPYENQRQIEKINHGKWIWPLLLVATFGGLVWFFWNRSANDGAATPTADTTALVKTPEPIIPSVPPVLGKLDSITGNFVYELGTEVLLKLPDSTTLTAGSNSTEARLFRMLTDSAWLIDTVDKTKNWVTFDRVNFETGKAILTAESQEQINDIAKLLKAFPASSIKIGGYTDNAGDSILNKKISDERAKKVMQELAKLGAQPGQVAEAVGYGSEHPVCPVNDTPECKAKNRRVDLKLAKK